MRKFALAIAALAMVGLFAGSAWAVHPSGGLPADKVVLATSANIVTDTTADTSAETFTIFSVPYKMSASGDIIVSLHMECKIVTTTTVTGKRNKTLPADQDSERGFARVWIKVESHDNAANFIVLNTSELVETGAGSDGSDDPDPNADPTGTAIAINEGAVTMCDRLQDLSLASDDDETISLKLSTLQTHGFTWWGRDLAKVIGADGDKIGNEVNIRVIAQVFGENGGVIQVRKRVVEIDTVHFAK